MAQKKIVYGTPDFRILQFRLDVSILSNKIVVNSCISYKSSNLPTDSTSNICHKEFLLIFPTIVTAAI